MQKMKLLLVFAAMAALLAVVAMSAQTRPASSYGEDRAEIEDLQARYLFALDFHDPDLYVSAFTEDGVLDYGSGDVNRPSGNQGSDCEDAESGGGGRSTCSGGAPQHFEHRY